MQTFTFTHIDTHTHTFSFFLPLVCVCVCLSVCLSYPLQVEIPLRLHVRVCHHRAQHHHDNSRHSGPHGCVEQRKRRGGRLREGIWPEPKVNCEQSTDRYRVAKPVAMFVFLLIHPPGSQPIIARHQGTVAKCWRCVVPKQPRLRLHFP